MYWAVSTLLLLAWLVGPLSFDLGAERHLFLAGAVVLAEIRLIPLLTKSLRLPPPPKRRVPRTRS
ncbi:MAG: hypothetical protein AAGG50_05990 [Bacteroidota bacterium]